MRDDHPLGLLQEASLCTISLARSEVQTLFAQHEECSSDSMQTLKRLFGYLSERSQTVSFLLSWDRSWDAEIILRSFYETAAKILFITYAQESEKVALVEEYWDVLGRSNARKRARRAAAAQEVFRRENHGGARVFSALQDERIFDLGSYESKAQRQEIEKKWSFSEIVGRLSRVSGTDHPLGSINSLLHIYGMASHLIHADSSAMDLIEDRNRRDPDERRALELAHIARILSDQVSLWFLSAIALRTHFNTKFERGQELLEAFQRTTALAVPFEDAFYNSQKEFYNKFEGNEPERRRGD